MLLALKRTPVPAGARAAALSPGQLFRRGSTALLPLRPELAAAPRTRGRAPLLRPRAWLTSPQIASSAFTLGTVAVLPFYTLMIAAPNADITKRAVESTAPYVALGLLYAYLLYLSWTPDTIRAMFASKYWLPEVGQPATHTTTLNNSNAEWNLHYALSEMFFSCAHTKTPVNGNTQTVYASS